MINDKGILIKNIFYMLTYAFQVLKQTTYEKVSSETFDNIENLFSVILYKGVSHIFKQGLYKEYVSVHNSLPRLKGKLEINGTINNRIKNSNLIACEFDELSTNNLYNQIIKTTVVNLINSENVKKDNKKDLNKILALMDNISLIKLNDVKWNTLRFHQNNKIYQMIINICYFINKGSIQNDKLGKFKMANFLDEHMEKLFEKFVLEYYKKHFSEYRAEAKKIEWNLDIESSDSNSLLLLPEMRTDIMLSHNDKTLIIDAKYYSEILKGQYKDKEKYCSANLYQIFSYVSNCDKKKNGNVSGMLLYARTSNDKIENGHLVINGNNYWIYTLDLNCDFEDIKKQLSDIIINTFY